MIKKLKSQKAKTEDQGYTLIELTIVITILLVVGGLVVGIISSAIRGSTKTKITNDISQNGNYALSVITNLVGNAAEFESFNSTAPISAILTRCDADPISGNSGPFTGDKLTVLGFDGGTTELACNPDGNISSNSALLLDKSQVKTTSCEFTCSQASIYAPPRIDIKFNLVNASGQTGESLGSASFDTSVTVRNRNLK